MTHRRKGVVTHRRKGAVTHRRKGVVTHRRKGVVTHRRKGAVTHRRNHAVVPTHRVPSLICSTASLGLRLMKYSYRPAGLKPLLSLKVRLAKRVFTKVSVLMKVGIHLLRTREDRRHRHTSQLQLPASSDAAEVLTVSTGNVVWGTLLLCYQCCQFLDKNWPVNHRNTMTDVCACMYTRTTTSCISEADEMSAVISRLLRLLKRETSPTSSMQTGLARTPIPVTSGHCETHTCGCGRR